MTMIRDSCNLPHLPHGYFPRARLIEMLDDALARPLLVVDAPQGDTATPLVVDWCMRRLREDAIIAVWASLPREGETLEDLERSLASAVSLLGGDEPPASKKASYENRCLAHFRRLCDMAASNGRHLVVVVDKLSSKGGVATLVGKIADSAPSFAHLVVIQEADAGIPLALYLATGRCSIIGSDDLLFNHGEIEAMVTRSINAELPDESIRRIAALSLGHLFALRLICLVLGRAKNVDSAFGELDEGTSSIVDQFVECALATLDESEAASVVERSFLPVLTPEADRDIFGDTPLGGISRLNQTGLVFLRQDGAIRFIPLYLKCIQRHAKAYGARRERQIVGRVIRWHLYHDAYDLAIQTALDHGCWALFAQAVTPMPKRGVRMAIQAAFQSFDVESGPQTEAATETDPLLLSVLAAHALCKDNPLEAERLISQVAKAGGPYEADVAVEIKRWASMLEILAKGQSGDVAGGLRCMEQLSLEADNEDVSLRAWMAKGRGAVYSRSTQSDAAIDSFEESIALAEEKGDHLVVLLSSYQLSRHYLGMGKPSRAESVLTHALSAAGHLPSDLPSLGLLDIGFADVYLQRLETEDAREHLRRGTRQLRSGCNVEFYVDALIVKAKLEAVNGNLEKASDILSDAARHAAKHACFHAQALAECERVILNAHRENGPQERPAARQKPLARQSDDFIVGKSMALARMRTLIAQGRDEEALEASGEIVGRLREARHAAGLVTVDIYDALALANIDEERCLAVLHHAVKSALAERILLPFALELPFLKPLLESAGFAKRIGESIEAETVRDFLARLGVGVLDVGRSGDGSPRTAASATGQPLTRREKEIRQLLLEKMSYQEIADHLGISKNTVHAHCNNIYTKLSVSGREELREHGEHA